MFHDFKSEIKLFSLVALVAVVLSVSGILAIQYIRELNQNRPIDIFVPEFFEQQRKQQIQNESLMNVADWQTYRNEEYGFELKYPANTACALQANTNESISFGRITVDVLEKGRLSLEDYVTNFLEERSKEPYGWIIESRSNREINGQKGVGIVYRFGGLGRISEVIFIDGENKVFALSWSAGGFLCDESNLFPQILSTFRFVEE